MIVAGFGLVAWVGGADRASASSPDEPAPIEVRLEIDTKAAGDGAEVLRRRIEERANIVLRHAKVLPGDDDDARLHIAVRELGGETPGYAVTFTLTARDGSPTEQPSEIQCSLCTETELVARVEAELDPLIPALRELDRPTHEAPAPILVAPEPSPDPVPEPAVRGKPGMLAGGVTLLVVGVGSLAAGVALAIPAPTVDAQDPMTLITTRPVGYALLATGVALASTGAVLTTVAIERRGRRSAGSTMSVAPFGDRGRAGFVVGGQF